MVAGELTDEDIISAVSNKENEDKEEEADYEQTSGRKSDQA